MSAKCLKCNKGPVRRWVNEYSNYYDFKCSSCGFVWHEAVPDTTPAKKKKSKKKSAAKKKARK